MFIKAVELNHLIMPLRTQTLLWTESKLL
jgi:hypothetical protein